jgi:hypothetical protein
MAGFGYRSGYQKGEISAKEGQAMNVGIETLPPSLVEMRDAFFCWKERGFANAWESINAVADARVAAEKERLEQLRKEGNTA